MSRVRAAKVKSEVEEVEQPARDNVLVQFPQPESTVEAGPTPDVDEYVDPVEEAAKATDALLIDYDSIKVGQLERGSLCRIFRERWRGRVRYYQSAQGGKLSLEDACRMANAQYGQNKSAEELYEELRAYSTEQVDFQQLMELWACSPEDAERYFALVKMEAQREFASGHLAAKAFEPAEWMNTVWRRAQFLALRDTFIAEFEPDGGIEYALVDMLVQSFFMQQYWTEKAVARTQTSPVRLTYEYAEWRNYKKEAARENKFEPGWWDIPLVSEQAAADHAAQMAGFFSQMFNRQLRTLNGHRLTKYKLRKIKADVRLANARTRQIKGGSRGGSEKGKG